MHVSEILQTPLHFRDHAIVVRFVAALGITITISVARPIGVTGPIGVAGSLIIDTALWIPLPPLVATFLLGLISPGDYCQEADHAESQDGSKHCRILVVRG